MKSVLDIFDATNDHYNVYVYTQNIREHNLLCAHVAADILCKALLI